jgi:Ni/Co efflux regulator RcnB
LSAGITFALEAAKPTIGVHMKKLFLALALCAFVAAPAMAADHGHSAKKEETVKMEEHAEHAEAPAKAAAPAKKKKRTAKKVTTETTEEAAPAEATHN